MTQMTFDVQDALNIRKSFQGDRFRPRYHFMPPHNWMNDPNGVSCIDGEYHIFYQHNPTDPTWGNMTWGHARSRDLLHWEDLPHAIAPTPGSFDEDGCFSGTLFSEKGKHTLYYTGYHFDRQTQCTASSLDLIHWEKNKHNPILPHAPEGVGPNDFRDPWVFRHQGMVYMLVGASIDSELGSALLYAREPDESWLYLGELFRAPHRKYGSMWECPNFFQIGEKWILIVSVWPKLKVHVFVGTFQEGRFHPEWDDDLDRDSSSYAHLTCQDHLGRYINWGWIDEQRDRDLMQAAGWAGVMSLPRMLDLDDQGHLTLSPVPELQKLRQQERSFSGLVRAGDSNPRSQFKATHSEIEVTFDLQDQKPVGICLLTAPDGSEETRLMYDPLARKLTLDRSRCSLNPKTSRQNQSVPLYLRPAEKLQLRIFIDGSVLEIYANERVCLTSRIYPTLESSVYSKIFAQGDASWELKVWDLASIWE
ncbi:glycoside hydrolase family 32 protein [Deinococcus roseus]|uniref:beta-fructofuranosidase n=1 Tax=Deinococcus roseus TaxID=392414 RepID=A0ABQ2D383_9DEIO|nr:glycoside hydrolase family 32 protein [Deinococcus roseus]GGJ43440.1 glycosyl hydrolase family 32 [Deinococcus roseus]